MELLDPDALPLVAPTPATRLTLGSTCRGLRDALRLLNRAHRTRSYGNVEWRGHRLVLELVINAPCTVRVVWHTTKRLRELRLLLPTATGSGQEIDGTCNYDLYGIDVLCLEFTPRGVPVHAPRLVPPAASRAQRPARAQRSAGVGYRVRHATPRL